MTCEEIELELNRIGRYIEVLCMRVDHIERGNGSIATSLPEQEDPTEIIDYDGPRMKHGPVDGMKGLLELVAQLKSAGASLELSLAESTLAKMEATKTD